MHRIVSLVVAAALAAPLPALACGMDFAATLEEARVAEVERVEQPSEAAPPEEAKGATLAALMGEIDATEAEPAQANREKVAEEAGEPSS